MCATHMRFVDTKLICDMIRPHSSLAPGPVDPIASRAQNPAALPPARSRHVTNVYEQMYARHEIHEYVCRYTYWNKTWMSIAVAFWAQARVAFECAAAYLRTQASTCTKTRSPVNILLSYTHPVGYTKLTWTSRASSSKDSSSTGGLFRLPHANVAYQEVCTRLNFVDSHNWIIKFANRPCDKYTTWFNMDYSDKDRHILSLVFAHKQRCVR